MDPAELDSQEQPTWLPGELFLQRGLGSPLKPSNGGSSPGKGGSPLKSPLKGGRRLSTASGRRLSTVSARALPESHPVSPCSERGDASSSDGAEAGGSPQHSGGCIPAYHSAAPASPPAHAAPATEERVTLNLFVQEDSTAAAAELERLQAELTALRLHVQQLEAAAAVGQAGAEQAAAEQTAALAAAPEPEQQQAQVVRLVLNVVEQPQAAAAAAPQQQSQPPAEPVQLVLNIAEAPPAAAGEPAAAATLAAQLQRAEACREELARQAGQLRGRIAKLEGAVQAGEGRVRAQAAELESTKARARELEAQLEAAQAQVGVTPERARAERRQLAERAEQAEAEAHAAQQRVQRLEAVLAFEARQRDELSEFAAEEHQVLTSTEASLAAEAAQWKAEAAAAAAQLGEARQRLVDIDAALLQRDEQVKQLQEQVEAAQGAAAQAAELAAEWRGRAEAFDRDRQAAASNIRKAERELELVAQDNERLFRQLNFVRTRLIGQLPNLDAAVPDIGKLARELQSWCDREAAQRARPRPA